MIFDVKMDFTRKAWFVASGHMTDPPTSIMYSSVVYRDSVCIAFQLAALNDINPLASDIGNAYLNAPAREKVYTTAGPEFGPELEGKSVLIIRALYGLNSSGAAWRAHLASTLQQLGYKSCLKDGFAQPTRYLGSEVMKWIFSEDSTKVYWALSSTQYVKEALKNIEAYSKTKDRKLYPVHQPMHTDYSPEVDITPYLDDEDIIFIKAKSVSYVGWSN